MKAHLAIGLDDLAGVARDQGDTAEARKLYHEAGQLGCDLFKADPEALETRFRFLHTQYKLAKLEQSESQFSQAAELLRGVLDHVNRLDRDGQITNRLDTFTNPSMLMSEIALCEASARARAGAAERSARVVGKKP